MQRLSFPIMVLLGLMAIGQLKGQSIFLINESFESATVPPLGWVYTTGVQHSTDRSRTGARSARFSSNDHSIRTPLLTTPGVLSFWVFRLPQGQGGGQLSLQVQWHTNPNAVLWNTVATMQGSNNSWVQYTTDIATNPLFTTKTNIYIRIRGNSGTRTFYIDDFSVTSNAAVPDFTATPIENDIGQNITFTDNSAGSVTSWYWDFGAGADPPSANTQGPHVVSYSLAGFKTISLTVNGTYTETKTDYISILTPPQSNSATYTAGDIPADYGFQSLPGQSDCPGILTVSIPAGAVIDSLDVYYEMTGQNWGWMSEQRSQLRCVSPGGTAETTLAQGTGNAMGTFVYNRTGLDIANGVSGGGDIVFELHAGRTWGGSGCNTYYNKVDNNTWTVTVYYSQIPNVDFNADPLNAETGETIVFTDQSTGVSFTSWSWDFGDGADPPGANTQGPHSVTYLTSGFKTISLTLDGLYNETKTDYVEITEPGLDCLRWDDGINDNAVGRTDAGILQIADRFEPADLLTYSSHQIYNISLYVNDIPAAASIKVWQGVNQAGLVEYVSQSFTPVGNSWNEIVLDVPYPVDPNLELWIGAEYQDQGTGFFPAGIDEFTEIDGKSNLYRLNNNDNSSWATLLGIVTPIQGDWNLQACFEEFIPENPFNPPRYLTAEVVNGNDVVLNWYSPEIEEGFELYSDFALNFGNWTQIDVDEESTWGSAVYDFPNEFYTGSFIIFNPSETDPPSIDPDWQPYTGDKYAACFSALPGPNNDWLITPQLKVTSGDTLSFFHKSLTETYGLERFRVGISTTGTNPTDFTIVSPSPYVESTITWESFTYDLSSYEDQDIYIAINCISDDAFVFMVDNFVVSDANGNVKLSLNPDSFEGDFTDEKISKNESSQNFDTKQSEVNEKSSKLFASYKIYRDNVEIDQVTGFTYTDLTRPPGTYSYFVTAIYTDPAGESDSSNIVTVVIEDEWIWTGAVSSVWENSDNWNTPIVPQSSSNVIIPITSNNPVIASAIIINDLHIQSGASLTIAPEGSLTADGNLLNEAGQSGLIISSSDNGTGSLIHYAENVPATSQRYVPGEPEAWHILSSPMANQSISGDFTPAGTYADGTGYDFYTWYEPDTSWVYLLNNEFSPTWAEANAGNNFIPGRGYLVSYQATNPTLNFSGLLNTGNISIGITNSNISGDPFGANLIGNPYPSAIDWKAASGWSRNDLSLSGGGHDVWIWNDTAYNYGVYNSASVNDEGTLGVGRFIAVNQGFFVLAGQNGSLAMNNDVRVHQGAGNWLKATRKFTDIIFLTVESKNKNGTDEVMIDLSSYTESHGTLKRFSFVQSAPGLFITKNGKFFSALFGNDINKNPVIPVSFTPGQNGEFTLKASMDDDFIEMAMLHDKQTGIQHDLKLTAKYEFQAKTGDNPARFVLQLKEGNFPDPHQQLPVSIFSHNKIIYVDMRLVESKCALSMYDVTGRMVLKIPLQGGMQHKIEPPYKHGVYVVYLTGNDGSVSKKIIF
jgi:PKD repeat protein